MNAEYRILRLLEPSFPWIVAKVLDVYISVRRADSGEDIRFHMNVTVSCERLGTGRYRILANTVRLLDLYSVDDYMQRLAL